MRTGRDRSRRQLGFGECGLSFGLATKEDVLGIEDNVPQAQNLVVLDTIDLPRLNVKDAHLCTPHDTEFQS